MKTYLDQIRILNLPLNWTVVRKGWIGPMNFPPLISAGEIRTYADMQILHASDTELADVAALCTSYDSEVISECLSRLTSDIDANADRVWRAVLLQDMLDTLASVTDVYEKFSQIYEFWCNCEQPEELPFQLQGFDNNISPQEYYTVENYALQHSRLVRWVASEIEILSVAAQ